MCLLISPSQSVFPLTSFNNGQSRKILPVHSSNEQISSKHCYISDTLSIALCCCLLCVQGFFFCRFHYLRKKMLLLLVVLILYSGVPSFLSVAPGGRLAKLLVFCYIINLLKLLLYSILGYEIGSSGYTSIISS